MSDLTRRRLLSGAASVPLAALLPGRWRAHAGAAGWRFFTEREAAVVREATARLIPGPTDDPREAGHPGAREANVVGYIDTALGALSFDPPRVFAGGPFSDRAGSAEDDMAVFVELTPVQWAAWQQRIGGLQETYRRGVVLLDALAGGSFALANPARQDQILASRVAASFADVLFTHAIEGMYSIPEYGGNLNMAGWEDIGYPGDCQPTGYTDAEVSQGDGADATEAMIDAAAFARALPLLVRRGRRGG